MKGLFRLSKEDYFQCCSARAPSGPQPGDLCGINGASAAKLMQKDPPGSRCGVGLVSPTLWAVHTHHPPPGPGPPTRTDEKEDYFRSVPKESVQILMQPPLLLTKVPMHRTGCQEPSLRIYCRKAVWQPCTGNQSCVVAFFNFSNIHKSSAFIKSMYNHFYKEL